MPWGPQERLEMSECTVHVYKIEFDHGDVDIILLHPSDNFWFCNTTGCIFNNGNSV